MFFTWTEDGAKRSNGEPEGGIWRDGDSLILPKLASIQNKCHSEAWALLASNPKGACRGEGGEL